MLININIDLTCICLVFQQKVTWKFGRETYLGQGVFMVYGTVKGPRAFLDKVQWLFGLLLNWL